jgi:hypothetical protein
VAKTTKREYLEKKRSEKEHFEKYFCMLLGLQF